jgi:hypothetical protein
VAGRRGRRLDDQRLARSHPAAPRQPVRPSDAMRTQMEARTERPPRGALPGVIRRTGPRPSRRRGPGWRLGTGTRAASGSLRRGCRVARSAAARPAVPRRSPSGPRPRARTDGPADLRRMLVDSGGVSVRWRRPPVPPGSAEAGRALPADKGLGLLLGRGLEAASLVGLEVFLRNFTTLPRHPRRSTSLRTSSWDTARRPGSAGRLGAAQQQRQGCEGGEKNEQATRTRPRRHQAYGPNRLCVQRRAMSSAVVAARRSARGGESTTPARAGVHPSALLTTEPPSTGAGGGTRGRCGLPWTP